MKVQPFLLSKELSEKLIKDGYLKTTYLGEDLNLVVYSDNRIVWGNSPKYTVEVLVEDRDTKQVYCIRTGVITEWKHNSIIKCTFPDYTSNGDIPYIPLKKVNIPVWVYDEE